MLHRWKATQSSQEKEGRPLTKERLSKLFDPQPFPPDAKLMSLPEKEMLNMLSWFLAPTELECTVAWDHCYHAKLSGFLPWLRELRRDPLMPLEVLHSASMPVYVYPYREDPSRLLMTNIYLTPGQRSYWPTMQLLKAELIRRKKLVYLAHSRDTRRLIENRLVLTAASDRASLITAQSSMWTLLD